MNVKTFVAGCSDGLEGAFNFLDQQINDYLQQQDRSRLVVHSVQDTVHVDPKANTSMDYIVVRVVVWYCK